MNVRAGPLAIAVLLLAVAILLLAPHADAPQPAPDASPERPSGSDATPVLRGSGPPAPAVPPEEDAPTETAWLAAWDPALGLPMGDDTLRGVVVDTGGVPIWDARVYLRTKPGEPDAIDDPETWNARTDRDGRWQIEAAWAERSMLCAWAPGYERASTPEVDPDTEMRLVLEPAVPITVTVRAPLEDGPSIDRAYVRDPRIRVRLLGEGGVEFPRPGDALAATWDHLIEPDTPTPLRIPRDVPARVTADAVGLASDPAFVALPAIAKELEFQLRPSAILRVRVVDAATRVPLDLDGDFWGFVDVTAADSGFELEVGHWTAGLFHCSRGVAPGPYRLDAQVRGYRAPEAPPTVRVTRPGEVLDVEVPLERDLRHATLRVVSHYADASQLAGWEVARGGPTLLRRREDASPAWRQVGDVSDRAADGGERRTIGDLEPGTYDVLVWDAGRFPSVGHRLGVEVRGGEETDVTIPLEEGYGFRPLDAVQAPASGLLRLRAQSEYLGALPWLAWNGESAFHQVDADGFAEVTGAGYVGPYPSKRITLVEQPRGGEARTHALEPSIAPPR